VHELSLVAELVESCELHAAGRPVSAVRVRCGDLIDGAELAIAFEELAVGTVLVGAALEIERVPTVLSCSCGFAGPVEAEHSGGHVALCPGCAEVRAVEEVLELVALRVADPKVSPPA